MRPLFQQLTAALTAIVLLALSVNCLCAANPPIATAATTKNSHNCCDQPSSPSSASTPTKHDDHSRNCPHCGDAPTVRANPAPVAPADLPSPAPLPFLLALTDMPSARRFMPAGLDARQAAHLRAQATLLGMHCALTV
ncbi:MAG: hypothetical protein K8S99_16400 [Planctomycetes bacterium]|nr:hypothetical protein [Planctomycetota bacterium]